MRRPESSRDATTAGQRRPAILFVSHAGIWGGGAEIVLRQVMETAHDLGYRTALAAPEGELATQLATLSDVAPQWLRLPFLPLRRTREPRRVASMAALWIRASWRILRIIRQTRPSLVHANSGVAALECVLPCRLTGTPLLWHQHDIVPRRLVNRLVLGLGGAACSGVIAVSEAVARSLADLGIPRRKVTVLRNAVRPEFFEPLPDREEARRRFGVPAGAVCLLMAGRIVPYKGHRLFLEAAAQLLAAGHDVVGLIAGSVPDHPAPDIDPFPGFEQELTARAARADLEGRIRFLGRLPAMASALATADILVVPSAGEPFPLVVLEGMAAGVPVVASDSGGHPEAIENGRTGLLFATGNLDSLVETLAGVLRDPGRRESLARGGRQACETAFSIVAFRTALQDLLAKTANRSRRAVEGVTPAGTS